MREPEARDAIDARGRRARRGAAPSPHRHGRSLQPAAPPSAGAWGRRSRCRRTSCSRSSSWRSCTTSASSPCRRRSSTSRGRSTPRARGRVRSHTIRGAEILAEIAGLAHLAPLVRSSHERWDGTGYPDRLAGPRIPLARAGRLHRRRVRRDDATTGRTAARCARDEARRRIAAASGTAFDPARRPGAARRRAVSRVSRRR